MLCFSAGKVQENPPIFKFFLAAHPPPDQRQKFCYSERGLSGSCEGLLHKSRRCYGSKTTLAAPAASQKQRRNWQVLSFEVLDDTKCDERQTSSLPRPPHAS